MELSYFALFLLGFLLGVQIALLRRLYRRLNAYVSMRTAIKGIQAMALAKIIGNLLALKKSKNTKKSREQ